MSSIEQSWTLHNVHFSSYPSLAVALNPAPLQILPRATLPAGPVCASILVDFVYRRFQKAIRSIFASSELQPLPKAMRRQQVRENRRVPDRS